LTALRASRIPVIIFVNNIDRVGADTEYAIRAITKEMNVCPMCLQRTNGEGGSDVSLESLWSPEYSEEQHVELIVASEETMLGKFLDGGITPFEDLDLQLAKLVRSNEVYPLLFGSAKMGLGIPELLDAVVNYFPLPVSETEKPLSALVYATSHDSMMGKIAHVRLYSGRISNRDVVLNLTRQVEEKVTQVRRVFPGRHEDIGQVMAGDIAGISGLSSVQVGDILGSDNGHIRQEIKLRTPLLTVQVKAVNKKDYAALAEAMAELNEEDPSLELEWLRDEAELHVRIMGWIQMEVLESILADRFNIEARFENPTVIYKETPNATGEGFVQYWMPKPCWAIIRFRLEPGPRGSGVVYHSEVPVNDVQLKYQKEVERSITGALKQGIKGWEVTDLKITMMEGEDHPVHSRAGDFAVATPMGIMNGLVNTGTTLLEPMVRFQINAGEELLGVITSDITRMRGSFESPSMDNGRFVLEGTVPLSTSIDFPVKLSSRSGGKARITTHFCGYRECTDEQGVIRPFRGISPLDTAKYILKARRAIQ
jgi:ribosomal protection tetracycline resistance protein